mgnify:CR=1 FL=1
MYSELNVNKHANLVDQIITPYNQNDFLDVSQIQFINFPAIINTRYLVTIQIVSYNEHRDEYTIKCFDVVGHICEIQAVNASTFREWINLSQTTNDTDILYPSLIIRSIYPTNRECTDFCCGIVFVLLILFGISRI